MRQGVQMHGPLETPHPGRTEDLDAQVRRFGALDQVSIPLWIYDFDRRRIAWANTAALSIWNADSLEALCSRDLGADMSEAIARRLDQYRGDIESHGLVYHEHWTLYPGDRPVSLRVRLAGTRLADGRLALLCEAQPDDALRPDSLRSVEALVHTEVMISLYGQDGAPLYRNPSARASVRAPDERLEDRIVDPQAHAALRDALEPQGVAKLTLQVHTQGGERWHELSARRCRDAVTGEWALLVSEVDVTAIKHAEAQAQYLAQRDPLTGLANRALLFQTFAQSVGSFHDLGMEAALLFIDLDHFKNINDSYGHATGDALLVEIGRRLREEMTDALLIARLGGDEFMLLLAATDLRERLPEAHRRLTRAITAPAVVLGREVRVTPSIGVSLFPQDGADMETLLSNADLAMYAAKDRGRNDIAFYDPRMSDVVMTRIALEADLRDALEHDGLSVHYQPIVETRTGRLVGVEALARWTHPRHGVVPPDIFVPICESSGLIRELGLFVLGKAAHQQAAWQRAGHPLRVSVNLSARHLRHARLLDDLRSAIDEAQADPQLLQVEITESMLLGHDKALLDQVRGIEAMGLRIALDDFGTGYSNLGYLQRFPIHTLKIDKSFIQCIDVNRSLAEMIVSMCRLMRLATVAEGVETRDQLAWVRNQGIEHCQGFLFSRALPADGITQWLGRPLPALETGDAGVPGAATIAG